MILDRPALESLEERILAPHASFSKRSRGRAHPEEEPGSRTGYQRDRDRILHTTAFRRLEHKTQVFITSEGDYYRTRLTHTLEVSQIGRSLARNLGANEDLVEAVCLAHDLGHPPFGHSGEVVLSRLMESHGGFDHNRQSLRIVTVLERRYPGFPGLNLTWETREGIVKHETAFDIPDMSEYSPDERGSLEAQIANAADECAYTSHDLDDGLRSGMLRTEDLADLDLWKQLQETTGWTSGPLSDLDRHQMIRAFIGLAVQDVAGCTAALLESHKVKTCADVRRLPENIVRPSDGFLPALEALRQRLFDKLYRHHRVMRMALKAERFLSELFAMYVTNPKILPPAVLEQAGREDLHRVVCDYIAGMTDRFAMDEFEKLTNPYTKT
ncbi:MAG: deoxyguanosinetriphosphate triphosphohydrolase [Anaerolineales bacterium]|nr:deoxyguanosinetriphosphate triphosphohydrolase [Anaerolineales bacterium]